MLFPGISSRSGTALPRAFEGRTLEYVVDQPRFRCGLPRSSPLLLHLRGQGLEVCGDHCSVDPEIVKGIFFYNRRLTGARDPYIADIYPTVLGLLGVRAPYELDGVELK